MRRFVLGAITTAVLGTPAVSANAGGSWFLPDPPYLDVGSTAAARTLFGSGSQEGEVSDGPFYAYLLPEGIRLRPGRPVPGPAIPLGQIQITPSETNACCWVAHIEFTVPDVPAGQYMFTYCNDPCTVDGVGDLAGGTVSVGYSAQESRLVARITRLRATVAELRDESARGRALEGALEESLGRADELRDEITTLEAQLARRARSSEPPRPLVPGWTVMVIFAAIVVAAAAVVVGRRRVRVPDFLPAGLVESVGQVPSRQPTTSVGSPGIVSASPGSSWSRGSPVTKS